MAAGGSLTQSAHGPAALASQTVEDEHPGQDRASVPRDKEPLQHKKVCYKGLAKNRTQLFSLLGLANLVIARGRYWPFMTKVHLECAQHCMDRVRSA